MSEMREHAGGYFVHVSSYVDDGATIGRGTRMWHFCHVNRGAVIGERCSLGQNVVVMPGTRLGNNVKVQNNVSIYEGVECDDDVFLGPSMVFTNVMNPRSHVSRKHEYQRDAGEVVEHRSAPTRRSFAGTRSAILLRRGGGGRHAGCPAICARRGRAGPGDRVDVPVWRAPRPRRRPVPGPAVTCASSVAPGISVTANGPCAVTAGSECRRVGNR